jgi:hypothetical protein
MVFLVVLPQTVAILFVVELEVVQVEVLRQLQEDW